MHKTGKPPQCPHTPVSNGKKPKSVKREQRERNTGSTRGKGPKTKTKKPQTAHNKQQQKNKHHPAERNGGNTASCIPCKRPRHPNAKQTKNHKVPTNHPHEEKCWNPNAKQRNKTSVRGEKIRQPQGGGQKTAPVNLETPKDPVPKRRQSLGY